MASFVAWLGANDCRFLHKCRCVPAGLEKCLSAGTFAASGRTARLQIPHDSHPNGPKRSKWGKWIATDPGCSDSPFPASGQLQDLAPGRGNACLVSAQIVGAVRRAGNQPVSLEAVGEPLGDGNEGRGQEHRADDVWAAGGGLARPGNDASAC
jgi:hypothetical protein